MCSSVKITALLAVLSLSPLAQATVGALSQPVAGSATTTGQTSPFGYERQRQKMMRPINDLLPQGSNDEMPVDAN